MPSEKQPTKGESISDSEHPDGTALHEQPPPPQKAESRDEKDHHEPPSAAQQVESYDDTVRKTEINRRPFLRYSGHFFQGVGARHFFQGVSAGLGLISATITIADKFSKLFPDDPEHYRKTFDYAANEKLLRQIFGIDNIKSAVLVPSANHPWKPPPHNLPWYPIEASCCDVFRERFFRGHKSTMVTGFPPIEKDDSLFIFGSQVSNILSRDILGNPFKKEPILRIERNGLAVDLRWNLYSPPATPLGERIQYGEVWRFANHSILGRYGETYTSYAGVGWMEIDYLLITSLPKYLLTPLSKYEQGERVVIFGGIHGPGTRAVENLLSDPPIGELQQMWNYVGKQPYFQALFRVITEPNQHKTNLKGHLREYIPAKLEYVAAQKLEVQFT